mmetsp:Transcript_54216/g.128798  ORF Transcript_54216/g.128798 Transcript_54216/m.128798 type:complete len:297 (+) Transcript_54216:697-1587(+)
MGLNFGTLCRLGGCETWSTQQAYDVANKALLECQTLRANAADELKAETIFAQGVLAFCKGEALSSAYLRSTKMEQEQLVERKFMQALQYFKTAYQLWTSVFGEKHLETVKAITMIGLLENKVHGQEASIDWYRKELRIREELQGELHPRTQQARRTYTLSIDEQLLGGGNVDRLASEDDRSAAQVAAAMSIAGKYEDAEAMLRASTNENTSSPDAPPAKPLPTQKVEYLRFGEVSLHCAELLNKWAASSPEYTKDIMIRAAEYSKDAVEITPAPSRLRNRVHTCQYADTLFTADCR